MHATPASANRAFGAENRRRLLDEYFATVPDLEVGTAWQHVYRLLLWTDRTIGLAHCYESDKCQPGKPWYARSLAFHAWLSDELGVEPAELGREIDWLFRAAADELARSRSRVGVEAAQQQRTPYEGLGFPEPGEDPELIALVMDQLGRYVDDAVPTETLRLLAERIHTHVGQENKRKNLLGEGFEDTLASVIERLPRTEALEVRNRVAIGDIPGFNPQGSQEKQKKVDLALWGDTRRVLVTSKWSIRADREEQFGTDFDAYVRLNTGRPFDYVLITNEFDAARLSAACERVVGNSRLFTHVVHVNPGGVLAAYGDAPRASAASLDGLVASGRLTSLQQWLASTLG